MKLSKTQQECLNHLKEHETFLHFMPYAGRFNPSSYYFASKTMKRFRESTVDKLINLGYLEKYNEDSFTRKHKVKLKETK